MVCALGTWATGLADRTVGDVAAAIASFATPADQIDRLAMDSEAGRARFEQAQLVATTNRRGASAMARRSLQAFARLGADVRVDRVHRWQAGHAVQCTGAGDYPAA